MGQLLTSNERMLFLASGDRNLVLREGDVVDTAYRLDHIDEFEATFTYLELGVQLRLSFLLEPSGVAQEERDVTVDAAVMHGGSRLGTAAGAEGEQRLGVMPSPNAIATRLQGRGPESSEELLSAAEARRARAVLAIPREPWVCAAQQANVLRDCDAKGDKDPTTACKQAAASRYRACLGSSLRSALPSTAGHEE
jgi:hypothetical protein